MQAAKQRQPLVLTIGIRTWGTIAYGLACALPLLTALVIKQLAVPVPYMDEWEWATLVYRLHVGVLTFGDLWHQHNEHRMLVPNIIALGLASLGGWSQVRETLFSLLLVVFTQIGIFVLLRRVISPQSLPFVFLAVSLMLFSLAQMENWDWGFQIAWFLCNACAVWAVVFLGAAGQSWSAWIGAVILATVASFSSSQGLMVWFAGLATLLLTVNRRPGQIVSWIGFGAVVFAIYFHGYEHPPHHTDPFTTIRHPLSIAPYIGAYFGSVFAGWIGFAEAVVLGWVGLLMLAALLWVVVADYLHDRKRASRANSFVGLAIYALFVAFITAAGRVGLGQTQAQSSRYTSVAIYIWVTIVALTVAFWPDLRPRIPRSLMRLWPVGLVAFALLYAGADRAGIALGRGTDAQVRSTYPALILGHGSELTAIYPSEERVEGWIKQLRAVNDGPYYK